MIQKLLYKAFGIRANEVSISLLMQLYIFLIITALLIVKPAVNAIFLNTLGSENLPLGYVLVAAVAVIATYFYSSITKYWSLKTVIATSLVLFSISFILLAYVGSHNQLSSFALYFYYVFVSLFAVLATSQFWVLANIVFNVREGKRLFGFIGAGAIAGGVFGGYLTSYIATKHNVYATIYVASFLLLACVILLQFIWKLRIKKLNIFTLEKRRFNKENKTKGTRELIFNSRHLVYIAVITGISVIVAKLVDFQFSDYAHKAFDNSEKLTSFFGFWFSTFNLISLFIQLFLTSKIVHKTGVAFTLLILPLGISLGCILFFLFPELWVMILIKGADGVFKQSVNKSAMEMAILPVPNTIKNHAKSYIDLAVDSIATGFSGVLLILLIKYLRVAPQYIIGITIFLILVWLVFIFKLKDTYFNSFVTNIERKLSNTSAKLYDSRQRRETTIQSATRIINSGDEESILSLLHSISSYRISNLKNNIVGLLTHPSNKVKVAAIHLLDTHGHKGSKEKVEELLNTEDIEVLNAAFRYLIHHQSTDETSLFKKYLDHSNENLANAALLTLAEESKEHPEFKSKFHLESRIENKIKEILEGIQTPSRELIGQVLLLIGYSNTSRFYSFISKNFNNNTPYIIKKAIKASGLTSDKQFVNILLYYLGKKKYRKAAIKAFVDFGPKICNLLIELDKKDILKESQKRHLPKVVKAFKSQNSVKVLQRLLRSKDVVTRLSAARQLRELKAKNNQLFINNRRIRKAILSECKQYHFSVNAMHTLKKGNSSVKKTKENLIDILHQETQYNLKTIFTLLDFLYQKSEIALTYAGLLSKNQEVQISSLELLENILENKLKTRIFPIVEYHISNDVPNEYSPIQPKVIPERALLSSLIRNRTQTTLIAVLSLIESLQNKKYRSLIKALTKHSNVTVRNQAQKAYQAIQG
ncbi:Npt1/Npt2 family nucleotide transporter [Tenacibaculum sp. IB213877]|uniref:Npt1/Npt2 family nucleotide transporter n=1 Tax=Tenacibaculum sp. IB213877 TaxID=3097351 RepID=UPI002A5A9760|nr:Npt1/Npt2 family nucleotide transporter [Tenacibaculum sp. IB213877]MDY0780609.1 MFS transporter [Tenacibaculum sp. IB213877]